MPKTSRPTWSASSISSNRFCIRWTGLIVRPVAGSEMTAPKLSTPICMFVTPSYSSCSSVCQTRFRRAGKHRDTEDAIKRKSTCPSNHDKSHNREYQQVKFKSLPFLSAGPVHEEAEGKMDCHNCNQHVHTNAESRDPGEESRISPIPPKNSAAIAKKANGAG